MSVIAKMSITKIHKNGAGDNILNLSCEYEQDFDGKEETEDIRFSRATPSGNAEILVARDRDLPESWTTSIDHGSWQSFSGKAYMLYDPITDTPNYTDCEFGMVVMCESILDMGYSKQVTLTAPTGTYRDELWENIPEDKRNRNKMSLKMTIDNDKASIQFKPQSNYWLRVFDTNKISMAEAISRSR